MINRNKINSMCLELVDLRNYYREKGFNEQIMNANYIDLSNLLQDALLKLKVVKNLWLIKVYKYLHCGVIAYG